MPVTPKQLTDQTTRHAVQVEGFKNGAVKEYKSLLKKMEKAVLAELGLDITEWNRRRLRKKLTAIAGAIKDTSMPIHALFDSQVAELALYEAEFEVKSLDNILVNYDFDLPSDNQIKAAVLSQPIQAIGPYQGQLLATMTEGWTASTIKRVNGAIRLGFANGVPTDKLVRDMQAVGGAFELSAKELNNVVRTGLAHSANTARQSVWEQNEEVVVGYRIRATLDGSTTTLCRSIDEEGKIRKVGDDIIPPLHINACLKGTLIETERGLIPIEHVKVGENVLTHKNRWMPVTTVMARHHDGMAIDLINNLGSRISFTNEHPILTKNKGWIEAGDIKIGDVFFHNRKQLSWLNRIGKLSFIPQPVLIDSYNIKTALTEELISYGIFSSSAGMSSAIKLNNSIADNKIRVICKDSFLGSIFNIKAIKNRGKQLLMRGGVVNIGFGKGVPSFLNRFNIMRWVISLHPFRGFCAALSMPVRILFAPVILACRHINKRLVVDNRLLSSLCFDSVLNTEFSNSVVTKPVFSFDTAKTLAFSPVILFNKLVNLFISNHNKSPWVAATCSDTVEYHYSGMVYNLAVGEDETYVAGGIVVHNCRDFTEAVLNEKYSMLEEGGTRFARDPETGKVETAPANQGYYSWLKTQPAAVQNSIVGPTRGKLLRNGGISAERFAELQIGKNFQPVTLEQMRAMEPIAFEKAGL